MEKKMKQIEKDIIYVVDRGSNRFYICEFLVSGDTVLEGRVYTEEQINKAIDSMVKKRILAEGHPESHFYSEQLVVTEYSPNKAKEMNDERKRIKKGLLPDGHEDFLYRQKRQVEIKSNPEKYLDEKGEEVLEYYYDKYRCRNSAYLVDIVLNGGVKYYEMR